MRWKEEGIILETQILFPYFLEWEVSRSGCGRDMFEIRWLESGGIFGAQIRIVLRVAGAQSDAMI